MAYEELLLSINGQTKSGKIAFNLVDHCVTCDQPDGNCKLACERLVQKYAPKMAPSYIQLKKNFDSKLLLEDTNPDEWMTDFETFPCKFAIFIRLITSNTVINQIEGYFV